MQILTTEKLKKKYVEKALEMVKTDRSAADHNGFDADVWHDVASGKAEGFLEMTLDLINADIDEMEQETQAPVDAPKPKKKGKYFGVADDYTVNNGDYEYKD